MLLFQVKNIYVFTYLTYLLTPATILFSILEIICLFVLSVYFCDVLLNVLLENVTFYYTKPTMVTLNFNIKYSYIKKNSWESI